MRGLPWTTLFAGRLLGCSVVVWVLPALLLSADPLPTPPNTPAVQSETPQSGDQPPAAVAELLSLIAQLDPLRITVPYIDYHDEAVAAQTDLHRRRRRAGFRRRTGTRKGFDANKGWPRQDGSGSSRGSSSRR